MIPWNQIKSKNIVKHIIKVRQPFNNNQFDDLKMILLYKI